jgi:hypothetical protein
VCEDAPGQSCGHGAEVGLHPPEEHHVRDDHGEALEEQRPRRGVRDGLDLSQVAGEAVSPSRVAALENSGARSMLSSVVEDIELFQLSRVRRPVRGVAYGTDWAWHTAKQDGRYTAADGQARLMRGDFGGVRDRLPTLF